MEKMNKNVKQFVLEQITFTLKIFSIIIWSIILAGTICYFIDIDGVQSVRIVLGITILFCIWGMYKTFKRILT